MLENDKTIEEVNKYTDIPVKKLESIKKRISKVK